MIEALLLVTIVILVFCSAFCSSSEAALFSIPEVKLQAYAHSKNSTNRLLSKLLRRPQELLVTIFVLNTVVNILIQNAISGYIGAQGFWVEKILIPFVILLFLGEIFPKQLGLEKNLLISHLTARPLSFLHTIFSPLFKLIVLSANSLSKILFFYLRKGDEITPEEMQHVLKKSEELGVLHPDEAFLTAGFLELRDEQVQDVMRPKEEIIAYDISEPLSKLIYLFIERECTLIPVYEKSLDHVLGILSANIFFAYQNDISAPRQLIPFLKKPFFCPETTQAKVLLNQFEIKKEVFSLVIDEYGVITGLITKEDLMEVVIGAVTDLRDQIYFTRVNENTVIAKAQTDIEVIEELFGVQLENPEEAVSIGGWLIERHGDIPPAGWTYTYGKLFFKVLSADPNRITKVFIQRQGSRGS